MNIDLIIKQLFVLVLLITLNGMSACMSQSVTHPYQDESHFSQTFGTDRYYRVYLPEGYSKMKKNYPVTYFFHGYGGRHFEDYNALLEYDMLGELVNKYQMILVMWNGRIIESKHMPYNIGCPEHISSHIQMKDYFPELVAHVDSTYNTLTDREHRAIIGYSMGGFMSFFMAGKYPDMIGAAVNMTGSPEFYVGYPDDNTLYSLRHTFANLKDVKTRLHNSSTGELSSQNREVHKGALWQGEMDYEYWEFPGGHKVDEKGETVVFEKAMNFVDRAFQKPKHREAHWSHYDLYPEFKVWDYSVVSNKTTPGFTYLRNVSPDGFGFYTKKWLPLAPAIDDFSAFVATAAIYEPGAEYQILHYQQQGGRLKSITKRADNEGRLNFELDGKGHEIGICKNTLNPRLTFVDYSLENNQRLIRVREENKMTIKLVNLGGEFDSSKKISLKLESTDNSVSTEMETYPVLPTGLSSGIVNSVPIIFKCNKQTTTDGEPSVIKFVLTISYDSQVFHEEFDAPVFFNVLEFGNLSFDDGVFVKDSVFGEGNGDGIVSPGERILIYASGHRTQLFHDDPYVEFSSENQVLENLPAKWNCDGTTASSIVKIAKDCPDGHIINFLAKYETKDYMPIVRKVYWGRISVKVKSYILNK